MTPTRTVLLDNEAVQALVDVHHHKHRRLLAIIEGIAPRGRGRDRDVRLVVPTAVRVEAGWDRRSPGACAMNRLHTDDHPLDRTVADDAANARAALTLSVADAHLAVALTTTPGPHAVVTSDVDDVQRIGEHLGVALRIVRV